MSHIVAKEFKTVNRVLKVGTPIHPDEYLEPHSFDIMKARGFIKEVVPDVVPEETKPHADEDLSRHPDEELAQTSSEEGVSE